MIVMSDEEEKQAQELRKITKQQLKERYQIEGNGSKESLIEKIILNKRASKMWQLLRYGKR